MVVLFLNFRLKFYDPTLYQSSIIHLMEKSHRLAKPIFQLLQQKGYHSKDKEGGIKAYINQDY